MFIFSTLFTEFNPIIVFTHVDTVIEFWIKDFWPPNFENIKYWIQPLIETIFLAFSSVFTSSIIAFSLCVISSKLLTSSNFIYNFVKTAATIVRGIPNLVWAYILFMSVGIGVSVGYYALVITTTAFLIRAFGEVIEESNKELITSMTATGASLWQKLTLVVIPGSFRAIILWIIHCLEVNVRSATIVGMVGGGGIGLVLISYLKNFKYQNSLGLIVVLALIIITFEIVLACVKKKKVYKFLKRKNNLPIYFKKWSNIDFCAFTIVFLLVSVLSFISLDIQWYKLVERSKNLFDVIFNFLVFNLASFESSVYGFFETISTSILATAYSFILGIFFSQFLSINTNKNSYIRNSMLIVFSIIRTIPTFLWVLFSLICIGFGPAAAIIGISVHSTAFFAKVFAQAFDDVSHIILSEFRSVGASNFQIFLKVILPLSSPKIIGWTTLRLEINFAESVVLGMVGAGGIGFTIFSALNDYNFGKASFSIFLVVICSIFLEQFSIMIQKMISHNLKRR